MKTFETWKFSCLYVAYWPPTHTDIKKDYITAYGTYEPNVSLHLNDMNELTNQINKIQFM